MSDQQKGLVTQLQFNQVDTKRLFNGSFDQKSLIQSPIKGQISIQQQLNNAILAKLSAKPLRISDVDQSEIDENKQRKKPRKVKSKVLEEQEEDDSKRNEDTVMYQSSIDNQKSQLSNRKSPESSINQANKLQKFFGPYHIKRLKGNSANRTQIKGGRKVSFSSKDELQGFQASRNFYQSGANSESTSLNQVTRAQRLLQENLRYKLGVIDENSSNTNNIQTSQQLQGGGSSSMIRMSGGLGDYIKNTQQLQQQLGIERQSKDLSHLEQVNSVKNEMKERLKNIMIKRREHLDEEKLILSPLIEEEFKIREQEENQKEKIQMFSLKKFNLQTDDITLIRGSGHHRHHKSHIPQTVHHNSSNPKMNQTQVINNNNQQQSQSHNFINADSNKQRMLRALNKDSLYKKFVNSFLLKNDIITKSLDNRLQQIQVNQGISVDDYKDGGKISKKKTRNKSKHHQIKSNVSSNNNNDQYSQQQYMNVSLPSIKNVYSKNDYQPKSTHILERARQTYQTPKASDFKSNLNPIQDDDFKRTSKLGSRAQSMSNSQSKQLIKNQLVYSQQPMQEVSQGSGEVSDPIYEIKKKKSKTKKRKNKSKKRDFVISKSFITTNDVYLGNNQF